MMKKMFLMLCLFFMISATTVMANGTILVPDEVDKIVSLTISTGGGKSTIMYAKIFCKLKNGRYVLYIAKKVSAGSLLDFQDLSLNQNIM